MKPLIGITADIDKGELKVKKDYVNAVSDAGGLPFIIAPVANVADIADTIDGILLSGGGDIPPEYYGEKISVPSDVIKPVEKERIDFEMSLFKEIMKRQKPILGICYGMQLVNVAFGGSLYQDIKLQAKGAENHRQGEHSIKITKPSAINLKPSAYVVNSSHHQAVKNLANGFETFAMSEDGIIEGFYKKDYPFLVCVQWHPEMGLNRDKISSALFGSFIDASKRTKCIR